MADTKETIACPGCGKEMKKIFIENMNINIDICSDGCGGIFFDNREFEKFDESHEDANIIFNELEGKEFKPVDDEQKRICPICKIPMVKMGANGGVTIDVCNVCGAKFLDNGELKTIREALSDDKKFQAYFDVQYQEMNDKNKKEILGNIGMFLNKYIPSSKARSSSENIVKKILDNTSNKL